MNGEAEGENQRNFKGNSTELLEGMQSNFQTELKGTIEGSVNGALKVNLNEPLKGIQRNIKGT